MNFKRGNTCCGGRRIVDLRESSLSAEGEPSARNTGVPSANAKRWLAAVSAEAALGQVGVRRAADDPLRDDGPGPVACSSGPRQGVGSSSDVVPAPAPVLVTHEGGRTTEFPARDSTAKRPSFRGEEGARAPRARRVAIVADGALAGSGQPAGEPQPHRGIEWVDDAIRDRWLDEVESDGPRDLEDVA